MSTDITNQPQQDDSDEHKLNRKEVIHLGFQNKTKGEAAFNAISYIGFGYFVVTATSVLMTFLMQDSKALGWMGKQLKETSLRFHLPPSFGNIGSLFIGGTIASVLPVKWLEGNKPLFVKKLDHLFYDDEQYANDPKIQIAHQELDELPKQTWGSVLGSRVVAFAATLGVFLLAGSNKSPVYKWTREKFSLDKASVELGRATDKLFNHGTESVIEDIKAATKENKRRMGLPEEHPDYMINSDVIRPDDHRLEPTTPVDRKVSRVFSYIWLDAFYTAITSASLWVSTRVFGAVIGQKQPTISAQQEKETYTPLFVHKNANALALPAKSAASEPTLETPPNHPTTTVGSSVHLERVAEPHHSAELTA